MSYRDPREPNADLPEKQLRACFNTDTIRVYQAYSSNIAKAAVASQTFLPPFKRSRMTWIKPSFSWMMFRAGWGHKEGQEHVLAIDICRSGFESALSRATISHHESSIHGTYEQWRQELETAPVRVQWDPEKNWKFEAMPWRTIQIGLGPSCCWRICG